LDIELIKNVKDYIMPSIVK
jgi:hypothetical protein